jgi:hypothetical protein
MSTLASARAVNAGSYRVGLHQQKSCELADSCAHRQVRGRVPTCHRVTAVLALAV